MSFFPAPSEMPPLVSHKPKHACDNFPLCKGQQKRPKLPRLSSRVGCPLHVRSKDSSSKKRRYSCLSDESSNGCKYDPSKKRRCSAPFCPEPPAPDRGSLCFSCEAGRTPSPELCGRRSLPAKNGYCFLCQPPAGSASDNMYGNHRNVNRGPQTKHLYAECKMCK